MVELLNRFLHEWVNYFRIANCKSATASLMGCMRQRLRVKQMRR